MSATLIQRERWVCLTCRKMFRPRYVAHDARDEAAFVRHARRSVVCPECRAPMHPVGRYFKPPKQSNLKQWEKVRRLLAAGVNFSGYEGRLPKRLSEVDAYLAEREDAKSGRDGR